MSHLGFALTAKGFLFVCTLHFRTHNKSFWPPVKMKSKREKSRSFSKLPKLKLMALHLYWTDNSIHPVSSIKKSPKWIKKNMFGFQHHKTIYSFDCNMFTSFFCSYFYHYFLKALAPGRPIDCIDTFFSFSNKIEIFAAKKKKKIIRIFRWLSAIHKHELISRRQ